LIPLKLQLIFEKQTVQILTCGFNLKSDSLWHICNPMVHHFLVYQAYGHQDILNEALVSVASVFKAATDGILPHIVIYTDNVAYFQQFLPPSVQYRTTPKEKWEEWKGERQFVHRAKIMMLRDFASHYRGAVLYCDTDTYFLKPPSVVYSKLAPGQLLMHIDEGRIRQSDNLVFAKLEKFLQKYQYQGASISSDVHMWNAGVLGFSSENKALLDQVLAFSDDLHKAYPKHVMEQFAFSYFFQQQSLRACDDAIFHYWDFKEYRVVLREFFQQNQNEPFEAWSKRLDAILPMELIKPKRTFEAKPYWKRKWLKWIGKGYGRKL
jgi:hypothetical protein